jgi:hypothetical protein
MNIFSAPYPWTLSAYAPPSVWETFEDTDTYIASKHHDMITHWHSHIPEEWNAQMTGLLITEVSREIMDLWNVLVCMYYTN